MNIINEYLTYILLFATIATIFSIVISITATVQHIKDNPIKTKMDFLKAYFVVPLGSFIICFFYPVIKIVIGIVKFCKWWINLPDDDSQVEEESKEVIASGKTAGVVLPNDTHTLGLKVIMLGEREHLDGNFLYYRNGNHLYLSEYLKDEYLRYYDERITCYIVRLYKPAEVLRQEDRVLSLFYNYHDLENKPVYYVNLKYITD